jgi:hypothetical protein
MAIVILVTSERMPEPHRRASEFSVDRFSFNEQWNNVYKLFVRRPFAFAVASALTVRSQGAEGMVKAKVATCPFAEPERSLWLSACPAPLIRATRRKQAPDATS